MLNFPHVILVKFKKKTSRFYKSSNNKNFDHAKPYLLGVFNIPKHAWYYIVIHEYLYLNIFL